MRTAFDQALEERALREAAEDYALKRGKSGSPDYDAAWLRFRHRIRTLDDLERWRASTRYRRKAAL
jgi:predicted RNA polymerase sigma factor